MVMVRNWPLYPILIGFVALATTYSVVTPIFEASDELWHYPFIKHLSEGKGLPVLDPDPDRNVARQEGGQPPLYYMLGAALTFWIDTGPAEKLVWRNPHAHIGVPLALGNKNMAIHTPDEDFPYRGVALAVHIVRLFSVMLGATAIACTYFTTLILFPGRRDLAAGAAALHAFIPQFLFISGSVNNDNLANAVSSLVILLTVRFVMDPRQNWIPFALGLALGVAALSKLSALGLFPLVALALGARALSLRPLFPLFLKAAIIFSLAALIAGWWYVRNWILYGDPLGLRAFLSIVGTRQLTLAELWSELEGLKINFWGLFGGVNLLADSWVYQIFDSLAALSALGLLLSLGIRTSWAKGILIRPPKIRPPRSFPRQWLGNPRLIAVSLVILWPVVVGAMLVRWTTMTMGSQGRLLFPALSSIAIVFFFGLAGLAPRRYAGAVAVLVGSTTFLLSALIPFRNIAPAYARPVLLPNPAAAAVSNPVEVRFGDSIALLGYHLARTRAYPGEAIDLTLFWQALARADQDYSLFIHLIGLNGWMAAQIDTYPGWGTYPTSLWRDGQVIVDRYRLIVRRETPPGVYEIKMGFYTLSDMQRLPAWGAGGVSLGNAFTLGRVKVAPLSFEQSMPEQRVGADFEDGISLVGYDLDRSEVPAGGSLKLVLFWKARVPPERDYTVFTQLLDARDQLWGQHDSPPQKGAYPTSYWDKGEIIVDHHTIMVRRDAPSGVYRLIAGLYQSPENVRLKRQDSAAPIDHVVLGEIRVTLPHAVPGD